MNSLAAACEPRLIDRVQFAELIGCSLRHIDNLDASGALPQPVRLGRLKRWKVADVDKWLAAGCPASTIAVEGSDDVISIDFRASDV